MGVVPPLWPGGVPTPPTDLPKRGPPLPPPLSAGWGTTPLNYRNSGIGPCEVHDETHIIRLRKREGGSPPLWPGGVPTPSPPASKREGPPWPPRSQRDRGLPPLNYRKGGIGPSEVHNRLHVFRITERGIKR